MAGTANRERRAMVSPNLVRLEDRSTPATPVDVANALDLPEETQVSVEGHPASSHVVTRDVSYAAVGFPTGRDEDFLILSTGNVTFLPDGATGSGTDHLPYGSEAGDAAEVSFSLSIPDGMHNPTLKFDWRFLSNETHDDPDQNDWDGYEVLGPDVFFVNVNRQLVQRAHASDEPWFIDRNCQTLACTMLPPLVEPTRFSVPQGNGGPFARGTDVMTTTYDVLPDSNFLMIRISIADSNFNRGLVDSAVLIDNVRIESRQMVYLDFDGEDVGSFFGLLTTATIPAFECVDPPGAEMSGTLAISEIIRRLNERFQAYAIYFTTNRPYSDEFIHVGGGGDLEMPIGVWGGVRSESLREYQSDRFGGPQHIA